MLVYADRSEPADPQYAIQSIAEQLKVAEQMPPGLDRHSHLVRALIEAGQLEQAFADAGGASDALNLFTYRLAQCVVHSVDSHFSDTGPLPVPPALLGREQLELRLPEGFAFYAVYPEAFATAARRLNLRGTPKVIGIRSIGTTLGAIVAAALNAPPHVTIRPFGDPFQREAELPTGIVDRKADYVIVDEGPGQSGSSFASVASWLRERGVPFERIAFITSHSGEPGPEASDRTRQLWAQVQRVTAEFDESWLTKRFGPLEQFRRGERLKFLGWHDGGRVLLKFAGLGGIGERKLRMAEALHDAGFTPEPLGMVHGFLVERWVDGEPLDEDDKPVERIGQYIGERARLFPAEPNSGASIDELVTMCRRNISLALGDEAVRALDGFDVPGLTARVRRRRTDNKLDREKWLRLSGRALLKTDALDHHQSHDLIGCQDVAWDVAGAIAEFQLSGPEQRSLIAATGLDVDPELLAFCRVAYLAFRLGHASINGAAIREQQYKQQLFYIIHQLT
jgi:hypothetical protein